MKKTISRDSALDDPNSTANMLLDTAEQLFAENGLDNVPLRHIVRAAGHGNFSGAHYHFGTREVLIRKLIERRMVIVDGIRNAMLDALIDEGRGDDVHALIHCAAEVLAEVVRNFPWGRNYVLVIAQALSTPRLNMMNTVNPEYISGQIRTADILRSLLTHLDEETFARRMQMLRRESTNALAIWLHENGELTAANRASFEALVSDISSFMAAAIVAPTVPTQKTRKPRK